MKFEEIKRVEVNLSPQEKMFYELLNQYERALYSLGMDEDEVYEQVSPYVQLACCFKEEV